MKRGEEIRTETERTQNTLGEGRGELLMLPAVFDDARNFKAPVQPIPHTSLVEVSQGQVHLAPSLQCHDYPGVGFCRGGQAMTGIL